MRKLISLVAFAVALLAGCTSPPPADSTSADSTPHAALPPPSAAVARHYAAEDRARKRLADSVDAAEKRRDAVPADQRARRTEAAAELHALQLADFDAHVTVTGKAADHLTIALPFADEARAVILQDRFGEAWQAVGFRKIKITSDIGSGQSWTFSYPAP